MFRALIVSIALFVSAGPALAEYWYIINPLNQPGVPKTATSRCLVVTRTAYPGEQQIAGPFSSRQAGVNALRNYAVCIYRQCAVQGCT